MKRTEKEEILARIGGELLAEALKLAEDLGLELSPGERLSIVVLATGEGVAGPNDLEIILTSDWSEQTRRLFEAFQKDEGVLTVEQAQKVWPEFYSNTCNALSKGLWRRGLPFRIKNLDGDWGPNSRVAVVCHEWHNTA